MTTETKNPTISITANYKDYSKYEILLDHIGVFEDILDVCPEIQYLVPCIIKNIEFCLFPDRDKTLYDIESVKQKII